MSDTYEEECGYFNDKKAQVKMYILPDEDDSVALCRSESGIDLTGEAAQMYIYDSLLSRGWRRSGNLVYLNQCPHCNKCIPIRIDTEKYVFSKQERYLLKKNRDIKCRLTHDSKMFTTNEKVDLFLKYSARHDSKEKSWSETRRDLAYLNGTYDNWKMDFTDKSSYTGVHNIDYYLEDRLIGTSVADYTGSGLSSNYFYYDTDEDIMKRSPGTWSILKEIELCKELEIKYYYLGYWIKDCRKMSYKARFKPHELYIDGQWTSHE